MDGRVLNCVCEGYAADMSMFPIICIMNWQIWILWLMLTTWP